MYRIEADKAQRIASLYDEGLSYAEIKTETGHACATIRKVVTRLCEKRIPKRYIPVNTFKSLNEEEAYWTGFIAADGHIRKPTDSSGGCLYIEISTKDELHLDRLYNLIGFGGKCYRHRNVTPTVIYQYYNDNLCENLSQWINMGNKTELDNFKKIPPEFRKDFVRGYFDGDGHRHASGGLKFTGCPGTLDSIMMWIESSLGLTPSRIRPNGKKAFDYWFVKKDAQSLLTHLDGEIKLERKWNK